jgi:serine/threonine protein kinase
MPFFKTLEIIEDHNKYKAELKTALKAALGKKFLYFNKHKLTPKRDHLLLIDPPQDVVKVLGNPRALGKCELNDKEEIVLAPSTGKMSVRPVRKYVETFYKDRAIFVPHNEPEGEETELISQQTGASKVVPLAPPLPPPLSGTAPGKLDANAPIKQPIPQSTPPPTTPPPNRPQLVRQDAKPDLAKYAVEKALEEERKARRKDWATETDKWSKSIDPKKYSRKKELKRGGMGAVHLIESTDDKAPGLVMKTSTTGAGLKEMEHEAEIYKKIGTHPNVARCLGVQEINGDKGLLMEKIEGGDLSDSFAQMNDLVKQGKMTQEKYWGVVQFSLARTLEALAYIEEQGIVHNDIKSPNIMLDAQTGEPKIIDMGTSTQPGGKVPGQTLGYAPMDIGESGKSDVFALGATGYEVSQGNTGQLSDSHHRFKYNLPKIAFAGPYLYSQKKDAKDQQALQITHDSTQLYYSKEDLQKERDEIEKLKDGPDKLKRLAEMADKEQKFAQGIKVKKEGKYGADTEYTKFINWLMHPDPTRRPSAKEALNHPFLRDRMLDDDSAKETIKALVGERKKDPNAPPPKSDPTESEIRARVKAVLLKEKEWKKELNDGEKLVQNITKLIPGIEKLLAKAKPGQEVLKPKAVAELQTDAEKLKHFEERFGAQKQVLANVTREFGTLVPPDPKNAEDKNARKTAEADGKTLQALAKWSRDLVTSHANAVTANDALKALLAKLVPS